MVRKKQTSKRRVSRQASKKTVNKKLVLKALTDPKFRRLLKNNPKKALGVRKITPGQKMEIQLVTAVVKGIESQIASVADNLLCVNGDPCGIC